MWSSAYCKKLGLQELPSGSRAFGFDPSAFAVYLMYSLFTHSSVLTSICFRTGRRTLENSEMGVLLGNIFGSKAALKVRLEGRESGLGEKGRFNFLVPGIDFLVLCKLPS